MRFTEHRARIGQRCIGGVYPYHILPESEKHWTVKRWAKVLSSSQHFACQHLQKADWGVQRQLS